MCERGLFETKTIFHKCHHVPPRELDSGGIPRTQTVREINVLFLRGFILSTGQVVPRANTRPQGSPSIHQSSAIISFTPLPSVKIPGARVFDARTCSADHPHLMPSLRHAIRLGQHLPGEDAPEISCGRKEAAPRSGFFGTQEHEILAGVSRRPVGGPVYGKSRGGSDASGGPFYLAWYSAPPRGPARSPACLLATSPSGP